nr:hypothetical protein [Tanacetum cinerariifolium]
MEYICNIIRWKGQGINGALDGNACIWDKTSRGYFVRHQAVTTLKCLESVLGIVNVSTEDTAGGAQVPYCTPDKGYVCLNVLDMLRYKKGWRKFIVFLIYCAVMQTSK